MSEETLAPGQREIEVTSSFIPTAEEQALLDENNVTALQVQEFVDQSGAKQTINAAIGGIKSKQATEAAGGESETADAGGDSTAADAGASSSTGEGGGTDAAE